MQRSETGRDVLVTQNNTENVKYVDEERTQQ